MENQIGQVFTPIKWAEWLINKWNIFDAWLNGAHLCDPTAGQGAFVIAMLNIAQNNRVSITTERLSRLTLIEVIPSHLDQFKRKVRQDFGKDFPDDNIFCQDIITEKHEKQYDILIGNPPWANFSDLPYGYKTQLKPYFIQEGLVQDTQRMLLGSSRVDIAALVLKVTLGKLLKKNGTAYFYLPTSLFFGDGAHDGFRNYHANQRMYAIDSVYEFTTTKVFDRVSTAYCCAKFRIDAKQKFPASYFKELKGKWIEHKAIPYKNPTDPWRIVKLIDEIITDETLEIVLTQDQKPRQGVNTCGANSVFIFDKKPKHLPEEFLFPLATKENWRQPLQSPHKWILLPYEKETAIPLDWKQIQKYDALWRYLQKYKNMLQNRKGTLLQAIMKRGNWWELFGVGPYAFAPFKVIWQAYGKNHFTPIVLSSINGQMWQGNQAMHAFIPSWSENDANRIMNALKKPKIQVLLQQLNGSGKCNWAQPGKIKKILSFRENQSRSIFSDVR